MMKGKVSSQLIVFSVVILIAISCNGTNFKYPYREVDYHQQSFILFDFITYYKKSYGDYPSKIDDIKKLFYADSIDYSGVNRSNVKRNITDPFSGEDYKYYLLDENSFVLYSVGSDGVDDNADILNEYKAKGKFVFDHLNRETLKGDILIYHVENGEIVNDYTELVDLIESRN